MKKLMILFLMGILILPCVLSLEVESLGSREVMVAGVDFPTIFNLKLTNNGDSNNFRFSNSLAFEMEPVEKILIESEGVKEIQLKIYPRENLDYRGFYKFNYKIFRDKQETLEKELIFEIIDLEDAFEIGANNFNVEKNSLNVYVENTRNFNFESLNILFSSSFFDLEKDLTLGPNEKKEFEVVLNKDDFRKLLAGFYTLEAKIKAGEVSSKIEGIINFEEVDSLVTETQNYGFFIGTDIIEKTNDGNVMQEAIVSMKKNVLTRLFTSISPEPTSVQREGWSVYYTWERQLKPSETLKINVKTNWLFPLIVIILVVLIVAFVKIYSTKDIILKKRVSFVRAKGGEFALKVTLFIKARRYVERVTIMDRLPSLVKLYEKFGIEKPRKIDAKNRKMEWGFDKLDAGEVRSLSYIIYSKVGVLGRFALPSAVALYERNGDVREIESNKAFFMAEQVE